MVQHGVVNNRDLRIKNYTIEPDSGVSMGQVIAFALVFVALCCGAIAVGNYYLRQEVLNKIFIETDNEDTAALINRVSWNELRENMKYEIGGKILSYRENGSIYAPVTKLPVRDVNKILEYYIQPESVEILLRIKRGYAAEYHPKVFLKETGLSGLTGFYAIFTHPDPRYGNTRIRSQEVTVYFEMRGMEWKIVDADIPLIFIPTYIPNK